jgi:hypothetical protein
MSRVLGKETSCWMGIVVNVVDDPLKAGRVKIRVFGKHDDETNIPESSLPWSTVIMPVTTANRGELGASPVGLVVGSRVFGMWLDSDHQHPIILGTTTKSGDIVSGATQDSASKIDISTGSIPSASRGIPNNTYSQAGGGSSQIADIDSGTKNIDSVKKTDGVIQTDAVKKTMAIPYAPTIGSVNKSDCSNVLDLIKKVDPFGIASALPCLSGNFFSLKSLLALTSSLVSAVKDMLISAIKSAILKLAQKLGLFKVLGALNSAAQMLSSYQAMFNAFNIKICGTNVINQKLFDVGNMAFASAIYGLNAVSGFVTGGANLVANAITSTASNIFDSVITDPLASIATDVSAKPDSTAIVTTAPDNYVRKYSTDDPYPGFIQWIDPNGKGTPVFTPRNGEPNFVSADQHTMSAVQDYLGPRLESAIITGKLTGTSLQSLAMETLNYSQQSALSFAVGGGFKILAGLALAGLFLNTGLAKDLTQVFKAKINMATETAADATIAVNNFIKNQVKLDIMKAKVNVALSQKVLC